MRRMSFSWKMWALPVVSLLVFGIGLFVSWLQSSESRDAIDRLGRVDYPYFVQLQLAGSEFGAIQEGLKGAIAAGDKAALEDIGKRGTRLRSVVAELGALPGKEDVARQLDKLLAAYLESALDAAAIMLQVRQGDLSAAVQKMQPALAALTDALANEKSAAEQNNQQALATSDRALRIGLWLNLAVSGVIAAVLVVGSWLIIRSVSSELGGDPAYAKRVISEVAGGNLTATIALRPGDTRSLLAETRGMQDRLSQAIQAIRRTAGSVNGASREIAVGNADLAQRTDAQVASLGETVERIGELLAKTKENAENAKRAAAMAQLASDAAERGGQAVEDVVRTMESINETARRITEFVGLIDGIAFQTNILALNAAVEAARAGEQGRGFAVVASEVRTLAQRSAEAAKQVSSVVGDSVSRVDVGTKQVQGAGALMREIVANTGEARGIVAHITTSSQEQDEAIRVLSQVIESLSRDTTQNASLVSQSSSATASLEARASELMQSIEAFRTRQSA